MKKTNKLIYKICIALLIFSTLGFPQKSSDVIMKNLVENWRNRDGADFISLGFEISKQLIQNDSVFFQIMQINDDVFDSWMKSLQGGVFTTYKSKDKVDDVLYTAFYEKLKELMLNKAEYFLQDNRYGELAKKLKNELLRIKVENID